MPQAVEIRVYGIAGRYLGVAASFGEARRLQEESLPDDLRPIYAGITPDGRPLFYRNKLTPEVCVKYPTLSLEDGDD